MPDNTTKILYGAYNQMALEVRHFDMGFKILEQYI